MKKLDKKFIIFGSPRIEQDEIKEVVDCMKSGWIGTGPKVKMFEDKFKAYKNAKYAVAVNSCTAALHLSLLSMNFKPGDEVITTPMTFCATINAIIHSGARPVLADVNPKTMNIDPRAIEAKISSRTKAILPVHFAGRPCDMDAILHIVRKNKLKLIEDCAHAIEAKYKGKGMGTFGDCGCFSFYVTKNIITGEGGMVIAKNKEDAAKIKILALHGMSEDAWRRFSDEGYKHYFVVEAGFKYNMMDIQAAIGIHQLKRIEQYWQRRQKIWQKYNEAFIDLPVTLPEAPEKNTRHAYHLYTILIDKRKTGIDRDSFLTAIKNEGIGVGVHYVSIPRHPYYRKTFDWNHKDYPCSDFIGMRTVSLPISPKLSDRDIERVILAVRKIIRKYG